jgi:tetratricopeptide (TPR) repeat protein
VNAALALDPTYGDALAAKARVFLEFADTVTSVQDHLKFSVAAEQLARQAVAVAPRSISARGAFAGILYYRLKIKEARRQYEIMTSLPGFSSGNWDNVAGYAYFLQSQGEYAKSLEIADRGVASDPLNPWTHHGRAQALFGLRRYAEAKAADERALALAPNLEWPKGWHALILMEMGKLDQAKAEFRRLKPSGVFLAWEAILEWRRGNRAESDRLLAEIRRLSGQTSHVQLAEVLAQQGGRDEAIAELELAWTARDGGLQGIQSNEMLAPLRADPRFHAIVKRLDFPT